MERFRDLGVQVHQLCLNFRLWCCLRDKTCTLNRQNLDLSSENPRAGVTLGQTSGTKGLGLLFTGPVGWDAPKP